MKVGLMPSAVLLTLGVVWAPLFIDFQSIHNALVTLNRGYSLLHVLFLCEKAGEVLECAYAPISAFT